MRSINRLSTRVAVGIALGAVFAAAAFHRADTAVAGERRATTKTITLRSAPLGLGDQQTRYFRVDAPYREVVYSMTRGSDDVMAMIMNPRYSSSVTVGGFSSDFASRRSPMRGRYTVIFSGASLGFRAPATLRITLRK